MARGSKPSVARSLRKRAVNKRQTGVSLLGELYASENGVSRVNLGEGGWEEDGDVRSGRLRGGWSQR